MLKEIHRLIQDSRDLKNKIKQQQTHIIYSQPILSKEHKHPREARLLFGSAGTRYQQAAT